MWWSVSRVVGRSCSRCRCCISVDETGLKLDVGAVKKIEERQRIEAEVFSTARAAARIDTETQPAKAVAQQRPCRNRWPECRFDP
jgi:hypothetical protein